MQTQIFAHRGAKQLAPENTLIAFQKALALGVDGIETDVHLTKDHQLIIIHDEDVQRITGHPGLVRDLTLSEIKHLNANQTHPALGPQPIPTLDELVTFLNQHQFTGALNLEIKTDRIHYPGIEELVAQYFATHSYSFDLIYSSFNIATTNKMIQLAPQNEVAGLVLAHYQAMQTLVRRGQIQTLHPEMRLLMAHPMTAFHHRLRPWTVNHRWALTICLLHHYQGLITDCPALALKMRKRLQGGN